MGYIAIRLDVTSIRACYICNQSLTNVTVYIQVYMQVNSHLYYISCSKLYATKMKFGMIFTKTKTLDFMVWLSRGLAHGQGQGSECIIGHIEQMQNGNRIMSSSSSITCPRKLEIRYNDYR